MTKKAEQSDKINGKEVAQQTYQLPEVTNSNENKEEQVEYSRGTGAPATTIMDLNALKDRRDAIKSVYENVMIEGKHYGKPFKGSDKKTLLKAGGEVLCATFMLSPKFDKTTRHLGDGHREVEFACHLFHIPTGKFVGEGWGSCSTLESKYRYRTAKLTCPECSSESIIKGKKEYGGGWVCWKKKGGCGENFSDDDTRITQQEQGKVENPDIADEYNTVLKMAKKRAQIDAVLTVTGASEYFTQDLEDFDDIDNKSSSNFDSKDRTQKDKGSGSTSNRGQRQTDKDRGKKKKPKYMTDQQKQVIENFAKVLPDDRQNKLIGAITDPDKNPSYKWAKNTAVFLRAYDKLKAQFQDFEEHEGKLPDHYWDSLEGADEVGQLTQLNDMLGKAIDRVADGKDPFPEHDESE